MNAGAGAYKPNFGSGTRLIVRPCKSNTAPMLSVLFEAFLGVFERSSMARCLIIYA